MVEVHRFESSEKLVEDLVEFICMRLEDAVRTRGEAYFVVSGGNTPLPVFRALSRRSIPWQNVSITLADERLVTVDDDRSNERMVRAELIQNQATTAKFVELQAVPKLWRRSPRFDIVLLGLGTDGHTASLFPDAPELDVALRMDGNILQRMTPPSQPEPRLTLTLSGLCDCRQLLLHIEGGVKWDVLQSGLEPGPIRKLPIRALLRQSFVPFDVFSA